MLNQVLYTFLKLISVHLFKRALFHKEHCSEFRMLLSFSTFYIHRILIVQMPLTHELY